MAKSEWVRVRSESELRPGMTVRVLHECGAVGRYMLLRVAPDDGPCKDCGCMPWIDTDTFGEFFECYGCGVLDGAIYRLRDLDEADETTEVTKELEVTRG